MGLVHHNAGNGRTTAAEQPEGLGLLAGVLGVVQDVVDKGCSPHRPGATLLIHQVNRGVGVIDLLDNGASAKNHGSEQPVEESGGVVEGAGHEGHVLLGQAQEAAKLTLGEMDIVVGEHDSLGSSGGAGGGQQACDRIWIYLGIFRQGLVGSDDLVEGGKPGGALLMLFHDGDGL